MGSLKTNKEGVNEVQKDFMLSAVDIVADPSAPNAFVNGIMEGAEWIWNNGMWSQKDLEQSVQIIEEVSREDREETTLNLFENLIRKLKNI